VAHIEDYPKADQQYYGQERQQGHERRIAALEEENRLLRDALRWCGGSSDFAPGGQARAGWEKVCAPLVEEPTTKAGE